MKKHLNRYPTKSAKLYFRIGKNIISQNESDLYAKYNIHRIIKLLNTDFRLIKRNMNRLTHFNIQYTDHKSGENYLIVKIHKRGYFDGITYKHPILESNNFIFTKCLSVKNNIRYIDLKNKVFEHSLSNIQNINTLKKAIKRRYKKSLAHLSDSEKMSLGIGISELKIIKII
tara:strand:+ start:26 stop:541 length:516 start_codon:yes stop_codon:yes gene_type:complete